MIMGMPGTSSNLQVLEIARQPWTTVVPIYNGAVIVEEYREEVTGTGLTVHIVRAGPAGIELDLTPYFNRQRQKGVIKVNELTTRVTVQPGVPVLIMSDAGDKKSVNTGILSRHSQNDQHQTLITLTARM